MHRPIRDGRAVTVNPNECVTVTTGTLASTSVTDNVTNSCLLSLDPTYGPTRLTKKKEGEEIFKQYKTSSPLQPSVIIFNLTHSYPTHDTCCPGMSTT